MTLDKLIAIVLPHKVASLCSAKRVRITSVVIFVVVAIFFLPSLHFAEPKTSQMCVRYSKEEWYVTAYMYVSIVLKPIVPFVSITFINSVILYTICK